MMKPLNKMGAKDKAALLHRLIPESIPPFIAFCQTRAIEVAAGRKEIHIKHLTDRLKNISWRQLAEDYWQLLKKHEKLIASNAAVFADLLFNDGMLPITLYCLAEFKDSDVMEGGNFSLAVELLFM